MTSHRPNEIELVLARLDVSDIKHKGAGNAEPTSKKLRVVLFRKMGVKAIHNWHKLPAGQIEHSAKYVGLARGIRNDNVCERELGPNIINWVERGGIFGNPQRGVDYERQSATADVVAEVDGPSNARKKVNYVHFFEFGIPQIVKIDGYAVTRQVLCIF